ncbi:MAG: hypothetical protein IPG06_25060 [Haliea sp.]|nr:hypothetical protein [Haliea sp.]
MNEQRTRELNRLHKAQEFFPCIAPTLSIKLVEKESLWVKTHSGYRRNRGRVAATSENTVPQAFGDVSRTLLGELPGGHLTHKQILSRDRTGSVGLLIAQ